MATRLNKYLSEVGYCSRRVADKLIEEGKVTINGEIPRIGAKLEEGDQVKVEGQRIDKSTKQKKEFTAIDEMPEQSTHGEQGLMDTQKDFEYCLQELSDLDREVMSMTLTHSNDDICDVLELSNANLRVKIHRARSQLADSAKGIGLIVL